MTPPAGADPIPPMLPPCSSSTSTCPTRPLRPSPGPIAGPQAARASVPLSLVESAFLLASLRRLARPSDLPPLSRSARSPTSSRSSTNSSSIPLPDGYLDYLRLKLHQAAPPRPARPTFRKIRFLMIANKDVRCIPICSFTVALTRTPLPAYRLQR